MPSMTTDEFGNPIWVPDLPEIPGLFPGPSLGLQHPGLNQPAPPELLSTSDWPGAPAPVAPPAPGAPPDMANPANALLNPNAPPQVDAISGGLTEPRPIDPYGPPTPPPAPAAPAMGRPVDPYAQPGTPGSVSRPLGTPAYADVKGATGLEQEAFDETVRANDELLQATVDAQRAVADRKVQVSFDYAKALGVADQQYQTSRAAARAEAEAETASWMRDMERKAKEEPAPGRWWANQSSNGKALWLMSLAFGSVAASSGHHQNVALKMIDQEIESDIFEQRARMAREMDVLKLKGPQIDKRLAAKLADANDDHTMLVQRWGAIERGLLEQAMAPGPESRRLAAAQGAQYAGQKRLEIAGQRVTRTMAERENRLQRGFQATQNELNRQLQRDLAQVELQGKLANAKAAAAPKPLETRSVHPTTTGIRVVNSKGEPIGPAGGALRITEANEKTARDLAAAASEKYDAFQRVISHLASDEDVDDLLRRDPQFQSDLVKIAYQESKELDPRAIVTDKDFAAGMRSMLGADFDSIKGRLAITTGIGANQGKIKEFLEKKVRDYPKHVSTRLGALIDPQIPGYESEDIQVIWSPQSTEVAAPGTGSAGATNAKYGIQGSVALPIKSVSDLEAAQALAAQGNKDALPPYKPAAPGAQKSPQAIVAETLADIGARPNQGREVRPSLERMGEMVSQALKAVQHDDRAQAEILQGYYKAKEKAEATLKDMDTWLELQTNPVAAFLPENMGSKPRTRTDWLKDIETFATRNGLDLTPKELDAIYEAQVLKDDAPTTRSFSTVTPEEGGVIIMTTPDGPRVLKVPPMPKFKK